MQNITTRPTHSIRRFKQSKTVIANMKEDNNRKQKMEEFLRRNRKFFEKIATKLK